MDHPAQAPARLGATLENIAAQRRRLGGLVVLGLLAWTLVILGLSDGGRYAGWVSGTSAAVLLALLAYGAWRLDHLLRNAAAGIVTRRELDLQYRTLAENLPDPLVRFDREGRYLFANPRVQAATGQPPEAFIGKSNADLGMPEATVATWQAVLQRVMSSGRSERLDSSFAGPSGVRDWESIVVPEPGPDGQPATALVISRDITERLASARALQRSELRFRLAASFGQVWDWDIENDALRLPGAYWQALGFDLGDRELTLQQMEAVMHPDDRPRLRAAIRAHIVQHEPYALEFRAIDAQGRERWFQTQGQAVWNDKGHATYMAGTTFEITERKAGELALRIKDAAFESSLSGIALAALDGRLSYVNPAFCRLWGHAADELIGRSPAQFWREPEAAQAAMQRMAEQGFWTDEFEAVRADGAVIVVDASAITVRGDSGRALCMMGTFVDVTHRRDAQTALQRLNAQLEQRVQERTAELVLSEARYRNIFDAVPSAISEEDWSQVQALMHGLRDQGVTDGPAYFAAHPGFVQDCLRAVRILKMNRKMLELHDARSMDGEPPTMEAMYGNPDNLPSFLGELEALWAGQQIYRDKKTLPSLGGRPLSVMLTLLLPPPEGGDGRALCSIVDISEIDRLNAELETSLARLKVVNRELETFTYSVSHDLKAPLRGIDGYSRLLLRDHEASLDEEARIFLDHIRQATQHMGHLIDDLLTYSRLERRSLDLGLLDLRMLVHSVISNFADELRERDVRLTVDLAPGLRAWGDAQGLTMALRNLVANAIKFSRDACPPIIRVDATGSGDALILHVHDNGMGFDMKFHDRIFDIFQRLHRAEDYPGTGVGLAIVRKAMERMGGRAWADSQPGQGASFHLQLPVRPAQPGQP